MRSRLSIAERIVLGVAAVIIAIPGAILLADTEGYVAGKSNLSLTADLYSELNALGAMFAASAIVLLAGALVERLRLTALVLGVVALLPQGVARLLSYAANDGQHESYLRVGIVETTIGIVLVALAASHFSKESDRA